MGLELANHMEGGLYEIPDFDVSDNELVSHVRHALQSVSSTEGNSDNYNELILAVNKNHRLTADDVAFLVTSLKALTGAVSHIDIVRHEALLSAIFKMNMWWYGEDVMNALVELIISLAASNGQLLDPCLDMLVCNFMPPVSELPKLKKENRSSKKNQVLDCVHSALKNITDLVPLAPMRLLPIVLQRMPQKFAKEALLVVYVESMLRLESSSIGEALRETILMALVDRMIELDVEIGWVDILLDDSNKGIFDMELEDVEETADYDEKDGDTAVAEKLDSLMVLTCEHLKSCSDNGRLIKIFGVLLDSFQITVLDTYRSKFTQFVIFYACSLDPEICGMRFAFMLTDIFVCRENPSLRRMSAVAYLASYLSRGRFLESSFIIDILNRLVNWCCKYCDKTVNPEDPRVFYSACQAIMYVLCFRMRAMLDIPRLKSQLLHFPLELIFQHPLDPLKVCLPSIVQEFLKQTKAAGLFLRQTKAAGLFTASGDFIFNDLLESDLSKAYGGMERLDMFFPFDPCLLRNCDRFIRPNFVFWSMVRPPYIDEEGMTSDEDVNNHVVDGGIDSNFSDDDDVMGSYNDLDLDECENSLNKMSITPKSTLKYNMAAGGFQNQMRMPARIRPSTSPESL